MIQKHDYEDYRLACDYCEEECSEYFYTFLEAVEFKRDRDNRWVNIKDKNDEWMDLCPSCNNKKIIAKLQGTDRVLKTLKAKDIKDENFIGF